MMTLRKCPYPFKSSFRGLSIPCVVFILLVAVTPYCHADVLQIASLPIALDRNVIQVPIHFHGDHIRVFGSVPPNTDRIEATLRSRECPITQLARKDKVVLFWMAVKTFQIENIPGVFQFATTSNQKDSIMPVVSESPQNQYRYKKLKDHWRVKQMSGVSADDDLDVLFDGLVQLKEKKGLYWNGEGAVQTFENGLFFCQFYLPDAITSGEYDIHIQAMEKGKIIAQNQIPFSVEKSGLAWFLHYTSQNHVYSYALLAVFIALSVGILISVVFQSKGSH